MSSRTLTSKKIIGIDASRNRSGGAKAHLKGILNSFNEKLLQKIEQIHVWSYSELLGLLPQAKWLIKHNPKDLEKSLFHQLWWQYEKLPKEAKRLQIDILFNTDASTVCNFRPSVTMSRDLLPFDKREFCRYGLSKEMARLIVLRYLQSNSLKRSTGVIFLTKYASDTIQRHVGSLSEYTIIPHGVGDNFRLNKNLEKKSFLVNHDKIKCIYVSAIAPYKHQWNIVLAISALRREGYNIHCKFVGGGEGRAQKLFNSIVRSIKDSPSFIEQTGSVDHDQIPEYLKDSDIFIFASSCENMPNILIEGMCSGLPIACSNREPMPEILRDGGLYFDPEDINSIIHCLKLIIKDDELRNRISSVSKRLSEEFSWERCSYETFSYLCKVIETYKK